jgi:hypothetical protein
MIFSLKLTIYMSNFAFTKEGGGETQNTQNRLTDCKDRREEAAGATHSCPFTSIDTISFVTMMKRE